ncbi:Possible membrane protein [Gulosibacter sp. 10]|nr:Possible membrane protein [Gulosibacter sp. 10]
MLLVGLLPIVLFGTDPAGAFTMLGVVLGLWALLGALDWFLAAAPRRTAIERDLPERARLGETITSTVLLTNLGGRGMNAVVRDAWEPSAGAPRLRQKVSIPAGERRAVSTPLKPWRRGDRRSEFVVIRSWGPLRLAARQATLKAPGRVRVLPPFNSRRHLPSRIARLRELDGQTTLQVRGQGTEFDSLRDYVRGDDVRSIDWRATARRQELVVRTWRPERDRRVIIVIDTGRTAAARIEDETRIDTAIESALLLSALATRAGDRVDLIAYDQRVRARVQGFTGSTLLSRITDAMADVEPELLEMDWQSLPRLVREVTTQRSLVVLLTTADNVGAARELLQTLPSVTHDHLVMVASVTDPDTARLTEQLGDRDEVLRAAAAERALLDAQQVRRAMTRLGADTVTATPYDLPPRVADRYLELKKAGRL